MSNSCLRAIDADVCTRKSLLRLNQLGSVVPLKSNSKGLFVAQLAEVIIAFNREHTCQNLEVVTNVTTETTQLQQSENTSFIAKVAQRPFRECVQRSSALTSVVSHGDQAGLPSSFGSTSSIPGGSGDDVYDGEDRRGHSQAAWSTQPEAMGFDDHGRGKAQEQDLQAGQRLGSVFSELCH